MKKIFLLILLLIPSLFSCRNTSINGKLDGMWQLITIEKNKEASIDTKKEKIYYNIKLHLIYLQQTDSIEFLGRFTQSDDSLFVYDFLQSNNNSIAATPKTLAPFGIYNTSERFGIEKLTGDKMVLRSNSAILTFRKF